MITKYKYVGCNNLETLYYNAKEATYSTSTDRDKYGLTNSIKTLVFGPEVKTIPNYAFYGCSGLTSVTIPEGVTIIGSRAFEGCSDLTSVTIQEGVTSIRSSAFRDCSGLTSVTIPSSVTSIGSEVFYGCSGLTSVTIPEGVTIIGSRAFEGCSGLTSVTIPEGVTFIASRAFEGCSGLKTIVCEIKNPISVNSNTFPHDNTSCVLYVPAGCAGAYKAAEVWNEFAEIREIAYNAIEGAISEDTNIHSTDAIYNLRGQKVDGDYKGIVIKNGKKIFK